MKYIIDTCIWSNFFRREKPDIRLVELIKDLINESRILIIGPIRQELLSGVRSDEQFKKLQEKLSYFDDTSLNMNHYVKAAEFSNICRRKGVQGSNTDFLICAVSNIEKCVIATSDKDFLNYLKHILIKVQII